MNSICPYTVGLNNLGTTFIGKTVNKGLSNVLRDDHFFPIACEGIGHLRNTSFELLLKLG
ncbi:hypothetical protein D3C76_903860 [compost metagenome]